MNLAQITSNDWFSCPNIIWLFLQNILLSDSSSDEETESPNERLQNMLRLHKLQRKCQSEFYGDTEVRLFSELLTVINIKCNKK